MLIMSAGNATIDEAGMVAHIAVSGRGAYSVRQRRNDGLHTDEYVSAGRSFTWRINSHYGAGSS